MHVPLGRTFFRSRGNAGAVILEKFEFGLEAWEIPFYLGRRSLMAPEEKAFLKLLEVCARLPIPEDIYAENDFVMDVIETVLNLRMLRTTVTRALAHFQAHCAAQIRDFSALEDYLASQPENLVVAKYLWGYRYRTRVNHLRGLVRFFRAHGVTNAEQRKAWADRTELEDFERKVPGLAYAAFQWLAMRAGIQTIKPDVHLRDLVRSVTGRYLEDKQLVQLLLRVAEELKMAPRDLDWRIWEAQRKTGGSIKHRCSSLAASWGRAIKSPVPSVD
jgi:hypothetical protein